MAHSMPVDSSEDFILEDDYYTLLNLEKSASAEDITNAYRRFSKLYHPDKHLDPEKKKNAEILFNKIKVAYSILSDPHQRAIYDTLGLKGLETEGWQIVERTKTALEIREEYEQLLKEREERRLEQRTNPKGIINVGVNATDLFETYDFEGFPIVEISSMSISQSVEAPLSTSDTMVLNGRLSTHNGTGSGNIGCTMKKVLSSSSWIEYGIGAGNGFGLNLKGFRTLSKKCFGTLQTNMMFTNTSLSAGFELMLARQLSKRTAGYLTWKSGQSSSVNTMLVHDSEDNRFVGGLQFGVHNSYITFAYTRKIEDEGKLKGSIKFGVFGAMIEYGCEKKVSRQTRAGAALVIGIPSGVTLKLKISRANQTFSFPILLSEEILPSAIFYGTVTPIIGWYMLKTFVIDPQHRKQKQRETKKAKEANAQKMAEMKKEAEMAVSLMQETYKRIKSQEEKRNGLVILQAVYGNAEEIANLGTESVDEIKNIFDTTVQLQCLVKDSRLTIPNRSKSNLPGFYDPCVGEEKCLRVNYTYRNISHSITVNDQDPLRIPRDSF